MRRQGSNRRSRDSRYVVRAWTVPIEWTGETACILGGGPSLLYGLGLSDEAIRQCMARERGISDFEPVARIKLRARRVIAVNDSYKIAPWAQYLFFSDKSWYDVHRYALFNLNGTRKVVCSKQVVQFYTQDDLCFLSKSRKRDGIQTKRQDEISWNLNSGAAAINLAVLLGVTRIVLLGFDMKGGEGQSHHHGWHPQKQPQKGRDVHLPPWEKYRQRMRIIKRDADQLGVEIINCSPGSSIKEFPIWSLEEALCSLQ